MLVPAPPLEMADVRFCRSANRRACLPGELGAAADVNCMMLLTWVHRHHIFVTLADASVCVNAPQS